MPVEFSGRQGCRVTPGERRELCLVPTAEPSPRRLGICCTYFGKRFRLRIIKTLKALFVSDLFTKQAGGSYKYIIS